MVGRRARRGAAGKARARLTSSPTAKYRPHACAALAQVVAEHEEYRRRLAEDLHDELGQTLAALELGLQIQPENGLDLGERVSALRLAVQRANRELRRVIRGLYPSTLERFGLGTALEALVNERARVTGLPVRLSLSPLPELPADVSLAAYRVAQAALANCFAHARPRTVTVSVVASGPRLRVTVTDDGAGFVEGAPPASGLGLSGMRRRVTALGGSFRVSSRLGRGTQIVAEFVVSEQGRAA